MPLSMKSPDRDTGRAYRCLLRDAELLAAFGIAVDAQGFSRNDVLVDDLSLEIVSRHDHRNEKLRRRVVERGLCLRGFVIQKLARDACGFRSNNFRRLVDRI